MEKTQEKIQLLLRIVHRLNEAGVEWALGASMLLYFKGITSDFHDIDLMVTDCDAECVRTILSEMGESFPSASIPNPMYRAKTFMEFFIDSVEVDVMAGFAIVKDGKNAAGNRSYPATITVVMVQILSRLMGRAEKTEMIEKAIER